MIRFDQVSLTYARRRRPVLRAVDLQIAEGELCLVVGATGTGKSTLLGAVNGLVPHFTGGTLAGRVTVAGRDTAQHPPRELADLVGVVGQDPLAGFVTDTVEEELAYGMEQLAVPPAVMRKRVEETLDLLGLAELRHRALHELSGGQQQRVAIGSVLTAHPAGAGAGRADLGAGPDRRRGGAGHHHPAGARPRDHRAAGRAPAGAGGAVRRPGAAPGRRRHRAERAAGRAAGHQPASRRRWSSWAGWPAGDRCRCRSAMPGGRPGRCASGSPSRDRPSRVPSGAANPTAAADAREVTVRYGAVVAVREVDLTLRAGEVAALMGRNGSGKSSLLWALAGLRAAARRQRDAVGSRRPRTRRRLSAAGAPAGWSAWCRRPRPTCCTWTRWPPSWPRPTGESGPAGTGAARTILDRLAPGIADDSHPRDLSEGQKLALVLAIQLAAAPADRAAGRADPGPGLPGQAGAEPDRPASWPSRATAC